MFASYALRPAPEKVAIVGLGGGSMIHFLNKYDPEVKIDVIEIDPAIIGIAEKYFGIEGTANIRVIQADAASYLEKTDEKYDVIYMDVFLKPSATTDATGVPLSTRTLAFYQALQGKLRPGGVVAFNLNPYSSLRDDIAMMRKAFPQVYVFALPRSLFLFPAGYVVLASTLPARESHQEWVSKLRAADQRFNATFSFERMGNYMERQ
jgi:spermidine synthase